jgi:hypothetical protein
VAYPPEQWRSNKPAVEEIVSVLKLLIRCRALSVYSSPKLNYDYLNSLVLALPKGVI